MSSLNSSSTVSHCDTHCCEEIASTALCLEAFASQAKGASGIRPGGDRKLDCTVEGGYTHLGAQRGFVERNRQFEPQIGAVRFEQRFSTTFVVIDAFTDIPLPARPT